MLKLTISPNEQLQTDFLTLALGYRSVDTARKEMWLKMGYSKINRPIGAIYIEVY